MSGFTVTVTESKELEEDEEEEEELEKTISTKTLARQRINHILGNLGPKTIHSFLIKRLLISKYAAHFHKFGFRKHFLNYRFTLTFPKIRNGDVS